MVDHFLNCMTGEGHILSVGVFIFPHSSSFSCFASPSFRLLKIHSLFKHGRLLRASGNEVPAHLRCTDFSLQLFPHVGYWQLHVAPPLCPSGQAREDKRLVSRAQQPLRVDPSESKPATEIAWILKRILFEAFSVAQVDLEKTKRISGIITQGAKDFGVVQFVSVFKVAYSNDGESWSTVKEENVSNDKVRFLDIHQK